MSKEQQEHPFLSTPRALTACAREFARLGDCLAEGVAGSFGEGIDRKTMSVRRSPERCIIQVGHSAVTVAWIRSRRDSAEGELLIIHWRGTVAPAIHQQFERAREAALTATPVCETVLVAEATSEADWMWRSREEPLHRYSSLSLAASVIERLRIVHDTADTGAAL
jgi:hypothetical protein